MVVICHSAYKICILSKYIYAYKREGYSLLFRCFKYLLYHKGKHFQLDHIISPKYFCCCCYVFVITTYKSGLKWTFIRIALYHSYHIIYCEKIVFFCCHLFFSLSAKYHLTEFFICLCFLGAKTPLFNFFLTFTYF